MFYDRLTETTFVSILDALHRWRTHLSCAGRRSASPARPGVRLWVLSAAWNADGEEEQRDLAIAARSSRCDRRHTRYQATSPIPGNTSISPENIAGQSLSVGFRPSRKRPQTGNAAETGSSTPMTHGLFRQYFINQQGGTFGHRRAPQLGQKPRRLQLKATRCRRGKTRSEPVESHAPAARIEKFFKFPLHIARQFLSLLCHSAANAG